MPERHMPERPVTSASVEIRCVRPGAALSPETEHKLIQILTEMGTRLAAEAPELEYWLTLKARMSIVYSDGSVGSAEEIG